MDSEVGKGTEHIQGDEAKQPESPARRGRRVTPEEQAAARAVLGGGSDRPAVTETAAAKVVITSEQAGQKEQQADDKDREVRGSERGGVRGRRVNAEAQAKAREALEKLEAEKKAIEEATAKERAEKEKRELLAAERATQQAEEAAEKARQLAEAEAKQREAERISRQQAVDLQQQQELARLGPAPVEPQQAAEWKTMGQEWVRIANAEHALQAATNLSYEERNRRHDEIFARREVIIKQIIAKHPGLVKVDYNGGYGYHFIHLVAHDAAVAKETHDKVHKANTAQDNLMRRIEDMGADAVIATPTVQIKAQLPELETVGEEVKIHLMPTLIQQPKTLDMLFTLLEKQPELRDYIVPMKVRNLDNGVQDEFPEFVLYTTRDKAQVVVNALQQHFFGETGQGRVPRYNEAVPGTNGFIYLAESGGDLKNDLRGIKPELLNKLFDQGGNHAHIRNTIGLTPVSMGK